jgi:Reverse transcriptase (RNA-dependent DNA polymerase)
MRCGRSIGSSKRGQCFVADASLKSYFDTIPHDRLMEGLRAWVSDGRVLDLVQAWLKQDIVAECGRWTPVGGTPQGAVISPLLPNLYLYPLDERMAERGWSMVRYADDFVVLCSNMAEAHAALAAIAAFANANGLSLHRDKTLIGDCRIAGQGFDFPGYRFEAGRRLVRKKSLISLRDKIRAKTRRERQLPLVRPTSSSQRRGSSPSKRPCSTRDTPDEEAVNWRAACGKTARAVSEGGEAQAFPIPIRRTSGAPHVLLDRHPAKARPKRRASLDARWRFAMTERPLSSEISDRALLGSYAFGKTACTH